MILKQSNDGIFHLFQWDAEKAEMTEIAKGKIGVMEISFNRKAYLIGNTEDDVVRYTDTGKRISMKNTEGGRFWYWGDLFVFQRRNKWYCLEKDTEVFLGEKRELPVKLFFLMPSELRS